MHLARKNLQWRFLVLLLPMIVVGLLAMSLVGQYFLRASFDRDVRDGLPAELQIRVLPLTDRLHAMDGALTAVARSRWSSRPSARWIEDASLLLDQWPEAEELFFRLDDAGTVRVWRLTRDRATSHAWSEGREPVWLDAHEASPPERVLHREKGSTRLQLVRVMEDGGGWVGMRLDPARFPLAVPDADQRLGAHTVLFTEEGDRLIPFGAAHTSLDVLREHVNAFAPPVGNLSWAGEDYVVATHHDRQLGLTFGYLTPRAVLSADLRRMTETMAVILGLVTFAASFVILVMARRVARPLEGIIHTMERVAEGDLHERLPVDGPDEMARLSRSFNTMISDLHTTHAALRSQSSRLSHALAEVENVEAMKDSFLALVSHEVRTPLTSIMGGVEFLRSEFDEQHDETETEFMEIIYDSAKRLSGFMNDAIMMAQLQANRGRGSFDPFSFTALIENQIDQLRPLMESRSLEFVDCVADQGEILVNGDWTLLQVALQKVLHNSCRHNVDGGEIRIEVVDAILEGPTPSLERLMAARGLTLPDDSQKWMAVRVFNTGPILTPERIDSLFQRFELTHDIDNHQKGSGLSLPIAHYIMVYHGGAIEVRQVSNRGMAFYLVLPLRQTPSARRPSNPVPAGVDGTVETAHLVELAAEEIEALEARIEEAESASDASTAEDVQLGTEEFEPTPH